MGGVRVDADTQMTTVPGPVRGRRVRARACTAPTASAATRCRDLVVFGKLAGEGAAAYIKKLASKPTVQAAQVDVRRAQRDRHPEPSSGANPYLLHDKLCETMAKGVGIVRAKEELEQARRGARAPEAARPRR